MQNSYCEAWCQNSFKSFIKHSQKAFREYFQMHECTIQTSCRKDWIQFMNYQTEIEIIIKRFSGTVRSHLIVNEFWRIEYYANIYYWMVCFKFQPTWQKASTLCWAKSGLARFVAALYIWFIIHALFVNDQNSS